jgi:2-dehydropantoate 2-reductase
MANESQTLKSEKPFSHIAVMGAGAVGGYFGGMLARVGMRVTFIGRPAFVEAVKRNGLYIDSAKFQGAVQVEASSDPAAARGAELVLFCVKTLDTLSAAQALAPYVDAGCVLLSMQNGVENVEQIRATTKLSALPAVVYVGASVPEPGRIKHGARGDLIVGVPKNDRESGNGVGNSVARIAAAFESAGVPCKISENVDADLWSKLLLNCAANAISAIANASYGEVVREPMSRELVIATAREVVAVARAAGVELEEEQLVAAGVKFLEGMKDVMSSTAQDVARKKKTEIDALNGAIVRKGKELGVATPANFALTAMVKLIESKF